MQRSTMQSLLIHYNHHQTKHFGSCSKKKTTVFSMWRVMRIPWPSPKKTFETQHVEVWLAVQPPLGIPGDPMRLLLLGSFVWWWDPKRCNFKKRPPRFCLFFFGIFRGWNFLPSYMGMKIIRHEIRIPSLNHQYDSWFKYPAGFEFTRGKKMRFERDMTPHPQYVAFYKYIENVSWRRFKPCSLAWK